MQCGLNCEVGHRFEQRSFRVLFCWPVTKVDTTFKLARDLNDHELTSIARLHSVYGFYAARVLPSNEPFIEYDFSRLSLDAVRGAVEQHGIPIL
jgi:hypothetical protein